MLKVDFRAKPLMMRVKLIKNEVFVCVIKVGLYFSHFVFIEKNFNFKIV